MAPYDIIGSIALVKFDRDASAAAKKRWALGFLRRHSAVKTVLEKSAKISGRLRTPKTKYIAGDKTKEALHRENGCEFRLNVDTCYFSPRLSSERAQLASLVKKGERVLVMFGGVGVFAVVIAKQKKAAETVSVELGRQPHMYAVENVKRNKVMVQCVQGDVRKKVPLLRSGFDRIVMARPKLKDSFFDVAFAAVKRGGIIHYYGFYHEDALDELKGLIAMEARKARKKVRIVGITKAGDIGTRQYRYRVDVRVL